MEGAKDSIWQGISSIGNLWPRVEQPEPPTMESAWSEVWDSFSQAGDSLREAIDEFAAG